VGTALRRAGAASYTYLVIAMRLRSQFVITAMLAVLLAAGWFWLADVRDAAQSREPSHKRPNATAVLTEPIELAADKVVVRAIGTGEALKSASIHPSVAGEVIAVTFKGEQRVAKGVPLIRLDDKHQRLAVRLAEVAVVEARRQVERLERLAPTGAISVARLQTAQSELESAELRLDQAKAALEDRTVHAPFDGIIGLTEIERGDRVTEETVIATLDDRSLILVEFNLPEEYAGRIKVGDPVSLQPWTMPDRKMQGMVSELGSRIDPVSRSLRVKAKIANPDDAIRPGTSFEVRLAFKGRSYPAVREVAVLWSRDGAYVWRVTEGKIEKIFVKIVRRDKGRILVDGPLEAGDVIVVEGVQGLRVGQPVKAAPFGKSKTGKSKAGKSKSRPPAAKS